MANRKFKWRSDSDNKLLFKEEVKVLKTSTGIKLSMSCLTDMAGVPLPAYLVKGNFGYPTRELALIEKKPYQEFMIEVGFKTYQPIYYRIGENGGSLHEAILTLHMDCDLQGNIIKSHVSIYNYKVYSEKEIYGIDVTTNISQQGLNAFKNNFMYAYKYRIQAYIDACK